MKLAMLLSLAFIGGCVTVLGNVPGPSARCLDRAHEYLEFDCMDDCQEEADMAWACVMGDHIRHLCVEGKDDVVEHLYGESCEYDPPLTIPADEERETV